MKSTFEMMFLLLSLPTFAGEVFLCSGNVTQETVLELNVSTGQITVKNVEEPVRFFQGAFETYCAPSEEGEDSIPSHIMCRKYFFMEGNSLGSIVIDKYPADGEEFSSYDVTLDGQRHFGACDRQY